MKKALTILLFFVCFSGKAQKENLEVLIDESDVYHSIDERLVDLSNSIFDLVKKNKVPVYLDSLLKNRIEVDKLLDLISDDMHAIDTNMFSKEYIDSVYFMRTDGFNLKEKHIEYHATKDFKFFIPLDKTISLLSNEDKLFLKFVQKNLSGRGYKHIGLLREFSKDFYRKKSIELCNLGKDGILIAYKDDDLKDFFSVEEVNKLGCLYENVHKVRSECLDSSDVTGIIIAYELISKNPQKFELIPIGIGPTWLPIFGSLVMKNTRLFYLKSGEVYSRFSDEEKMLWDIIKEYNIIRIINPSSNNTIEEYHNVKH